MGQWQQAIRALTTALEESPEHVEAHHQLAVCHAQTGNAREARRLLQRRGPVEGHLPAEEGRQAAQGL